MSKERTIMEDGDPEISCVICTDIMAYMFGDDNNESHV